MSISPGDKLPSATLLRVGDEGPEQLSLSDWTDGRKVVIFAVPGAFTSTCTSAHVPSFIRTKDKLTDRGIEDIICISVNDPFVMFAWGESTGATEAGIVMLADSDSSFTKAMGRNFTAPPAGFIDRSIRYAMVVEDGTVTLLHEEESRSVCEATAGEAVLAAL